MEQRIIRNKEHWVVDEDGNVLGFDHGTRTQYLATVETNPLTGGVRELRGQNGQINAALGIGFYRNIVATKRAGGGGSAGTSGFTFQTIMRVPFDFYGVIPVFYNSLAASLTNVKASVFVMSDPTTISGSVVSATVSSAATFTLPAATSGGGTSEVVSSVTKGDVLVIKSVARTDYGIGKIVGVRVFVPNTNTNDLRCSDYGIDDFLTYGSRSTFGTGDHVSDAGTLGTFISDSFPFALQFLTTNPAAISVLGVGDSIIRGIGYRSSPNVYLSGGKLLALDRISSGTPVDFIDCGFPGQTMTAYFANGLANIAATRPSVGVLAVGSPNDAGKWTDAWVTTCMSMAVRWIEACSVAGVMPSLATMAPATGLSTDQEGFRRALVAATKSLCVSVGIPCVDRDAYLTDYSVSSGGYISGLSTDMVHPNLAGYSAEKNAWAAVF